MPINIINTLQTKEIMMFIHGKFCVMYERHTYTYIVDGATYDIASIATYAVLFHRSLHSLEQTQEGKAIFVLLAGVLFRY